MAFVECGHAGDDVFVGDGVVKFPGFEIVGVAYEDRRPHFGVEFAPARGDAVVKFYNLVLRDVHVGG